MDEELPFDDNFNDMESSSEEEEDDDDEPKVN